MTVSIDPAVLLTVRGTLLPPSLESARVLHNETAGSAPGIAAARALGDLSHKVYAPCTRSKQSSAKAGELLSFSYHLQAPAAKSERYVGMIRATIQSPEAAIQAFGEVDRKAQRDARARGLVRVVDRATLLRCQCCTRSATRRARPRSSSPC